MAVKETKDTLLFTTDLMRLGTQKSTHSFKWILPYIIAQQYHRKGRPLRILEYGPGCNSEQFLYSQVCECLVSIEDNQAWYDKFAPLFLGAKTKTDYHLVQVTSPEGKAYDGGHCWTEEEILSYANYPAKYGAGYFDIVFIDSADRHDQVTVQGRTYKGCPVRNLCLEQARSLLSEDGTIAIHDFPGPYRTINVGLEDNVRGFKNHQAFDEFYTTVLSLSFDLSDLKTQIVTRYHLGWRTRLITRILNHLGATWYKHKTTFSIMRSLLELDC